MTLHPESNNHQSDIFAMLDASGWPAPCKTPKYPGLQALQARRALELNDIDEELTVQAG